jgi:hypothetical protein
VCLERGGATLVAKMREARSVGALGPFIGPGKGMGGGAR